MRHLSIILPLWLCLVACQPSIPPVIDQAGEQEDTSAVISPDTMPDVPIATDTLRYDLQGQLTHVQPMTGLVLWPDQARDLDGTYRHAISMEFAYCLPCRVVTGKSNGHVQYDLSYLENILNDIASRNHQAIIRFRYEYPSSKEVDGQKGTTAVPAYIKNQPDYEETYSKNPGGDGPTYYADWSNKELQWFTKQFYRDLMAQYGQDPRIALVEVGFGHWSEYHIYGTKLQLGKNFPSKQYQSEFFVLMDSLYQTGGKPWSVSVDAGETDYSPYRSDAKMQTCTFGLFDDSFMHAEHDLSQGDGYNERCWQWMGADRWRTGICGGEISYYTDADQHNFLNPNGMYGVTWESAAAKYHISFMIANDAPEGRYGTADRFLSAGLATGYHLHVYKCKICGRQTYLEIGNTGIAPLYIDAYAQIGDAVSEVNLRGLQPGEARKITIAADASQYGMHIASPAILPTQTIEYD